MPPFTDEDLPELVERTATERRAEAEALFTSIGDGAISTDEFGRITRVNPAAQALLGYEISVRFHIYLS